MTITVPRPLLNGDKSFVSFIYVPAVSGEHTLPGVPAVKLPEKYSLLTSLQNTNNISCAFMFLFTTFGFVFLLQPVTGCDTK